MKAEANIFAGMGAQRDSDGYHPQPGGFATNNLVQAAFQGNAFDQEKLNRIYMYPASLKEAEVHKLSSKFGYHHPKLKNDDPVHVCPDCENLASTMDIPLCYSTTPDKPVEGNDVFMVATDASLYFIFIKMVIFFLILKFLIVDAYTIYASMHGNYCANFLTSTGKICAYTMSGYNLKAAADQHLINVIDILALVFVLVSGVFFLVSRKRLNKIRDWLDFNIVSQDDFAVLVEDIPTFIYEDNTTKKTIQFDMKVELEYIFEQKIHDWLTKVVGYKTQAECQGKVEADFWKNIVPMYVDKEDGAEHNELLEEDEIVTSITLCYDLTQVENINNLRTKLIDKFVSKSSSSVAELKDTDKVSYIPNQISVLNKEFIHLCEQFALNTSPAFTLSKFTGKAFICFQYQHFRDYLCQEYQKNPNFMEICGQPIKITRTNQPSDIFWYNMKITDAQRKKKIFYSYCILFMMLAISFAMLMGLQFWELARSKAKVSHTVLSMIEGYGITALMSIITNVINIILSYSIEGLANMEKHKTKSDRTGQLIIKIVITQTINTSIIYSILYAMHPMSPLGPFGLVTKINSLVVISGLISVIWQIVLPVQTVMRFLNSRKYTYENPINLFQIQLNQIIEYPAFSYSSNYSFYIIYTYVVCWYGFLYPLGGIIVILFFFIQYWVDKFNLFRRFSNPVAFGQDLVNLVIKAFEFSIFVFALGFFIWQSDVHFNETAGFKAMNIITLVLAILFIIFAMVVPNRIKNKIVGADVISFEHINYDHYRSQGAFLKTYFRESPATFCLKETKIQKKFQDRSDGDGNTAESLPEAPDPQFLKPEQYDMYLDMKDSQKFVEKYDKQLVGYFSNSDNPDYDYAQDEQGFMEELAKKVQEKKQKRQKAKKI